MERLNLVHSICEITADYRLGDLNSPTPDHVERWVCQFDESLQLSILAEMEHVLRKTYISKENVEGFLRGALKTEALSGQDPCSFWSNAHLLNIQAGGNSQREMNALFDQTIRAEYGIESYKDESPSSTYIYLDDGVFTGNRVKRDLENWIEHHAPANCNIHVVCIAIHEGGKLYAGDGIKQKISVSRKSIEIEWWGRVFLENRRAYANSSDVLWPTLIPEDAAVQRYAASLRFPPHLRNPGNIGAKKIFSSDTGRITLEQAFLEAGVRIRGMCPYLGSTQRPLGHMTLETLGFGSLIVTFRNCPNNAPLALWAGDPWYPLFPRSTNTDTANRNLFAGIMDNVF